MYVGFSNMRSLALSVLVLLNFYVLYFFSYKIYDDFMGRFYESRM